MSLEGKGATSYARRDLANQKSLALGFTKMKFAHKATAGQTGINLASLTAPPEMTANGFVNPSYAQLQTASLAFYRNNLKLKSSLIGEMTDRLSFVVSTSSQINFIDYVASEGEIFEGTIENVPMGGRVVDARYIRVTGTLLAGQTDFNVGEPFPVGQNILYKMGAVRVDLDRDLQRRNVSNLSTPTDDYYEVDAGSGLGTIIRFNTADAINDREVTVTSVGLIAERVDGSMLAYIEALNGYIQNIAPYVAALTGYSTTTILGAAPSNMDLKAVGDIIFALNNNYVKTSNYQAVAGDRLIANSAGGPFTITLPASPAIGALVTIYDGGGLWSSNNVTLARNGQNTNGVASDFTLNAGGKAEAVFVDSTIGWRVIVYG